MEKWVYGRTNAYDLVAKVVDNVARVLTQTEDFPCTLNLSEDEEKAKITEFMEEVIDLDYSAEWEEYDAEALLKNCEILFETTRR